MGLLDALATRQAHWRRCRGIDQRQTMQHDSDPHRDGLFLRRQLGPESDRAARISAANVTREYAGWRSDPGQEPKRHRAHEGRHHLLRTAAHYRQAGRWSSGERGAVIGAAATVGTEVGQADRQHGIWSIGVAGLASSPGYALGPDRSRTIAHSGRRTSASTWVATRALAVQCFLEGFTESRRHRVGREDTPTTRDARLRCSDRPGWAAPDSPITLRLAANRRARRDA